ncbi:hypothetical protein [Paraliomyxa miuraensis]|uniref:hypothetical protein n=1 Tax=Paraliomyxa miuraensis TaxID=376150 RepID=UPI002253B318|nr:hypothetical protein [Paraliomyxa miuraensis]MCX4245470.1 hypothetical protein [Paraliomyxa miuraensis]
MQGLVTEAVANALPVPVDRELADLDLGELRAELEHVAEQARAALDEGIPLSAAVADPRFDALVRFHQDLRDALFVELPRELAGWIERGVANAEPAASDGALGFVDALAHLAREAGTRGADARSAGHDPQARLQRALAELLVFEALRLRLLLVVWQSEDFERFGGEESDVDAIAWEEVALLLDDPALCDTRVRPGVLMMAAAQVSMARESAERAQALRRSGEEVRERLHMRARLRAALRELRLPESVLLENALSTLLDEPRLELPELQQAHPLALQGMSRQAMDQRVSRGRRALTRSPDHWPRRRQAALFDLLRPAG